MNSGKRSALLSHPPLVARCPDCQHPQSFHQDSCCSNAACYCSREFTQEEAASVATPSSETTDADKEEVS